MASELHGFSELAVAGEEVVAPPAKQRRERATKLVMVKRDFLQVLMYKTKNHRSSFLIYRNWIGWLVQVLVLRTMNK